MNKRVLHSILFLGSVLILTSCSLLPKSDPNIILILTDDQGWGDVGFNGNKIINTPTLDKLASNSVVFNRFYVSPVCAPTRAGLLTGKDHLTTGVTWVTHRKEVMKESEITMGEIFRDNGYNTAYFGKWHNGAQYPHTPLGQGFETFFGFCGGHINNYFDIELDWGTEQTKTKGYITDVLTDSVLSFIEKQQNPYLAYVAYNTPHTPYQVSDKYFDKYKAKGLDDKTACIYGMCENIDDNVARIISKLQETNQYNNTIIVYMSDNGPNYLRYNGGLKGRKGQVDEGGVRVPFLISYPNGEFQNQKIVSSFASHIDVLPTIMDICGISNSTLKFDGKSFEALLKNGACNMPERNIYSHHVIKEFNEVPGAIRNNSYLLTLYPWDTALYNLASDPFQREDILLQEQEIASKLENQYHKWFTQANRTGIEPSPIQIGFSNIEQIILPVHEATLSDGIEFAGTYGWANDWVLSFDNTNDSLSWPISVQNQCSYSLKLRYACSGGDKDLPIEIRCGTDTVLKTIDQVFDGKVLKSHDRVKRTEVEAREWGELGFGAIKFEQGQSELVIAYKGACESNIQIKELILNRIE